MTKGSETAEEALERYKETIGDEAGEQLHGIWQEVAHLSYLWKDYETLYQNRDNVDQLNLIAPNFFGRTQVCMLHTVSLIISRLIDPVGSGNKMNVTIHALNALPDSFEIKGLIETIVKLSSPYKVLRNKVIAHNDYETKINGEKFDSLTYEIPEILKEYEELFNKIFPATIHSFAVTSNPYGAGRLIREMKNIQRSVQ